MTTTYAGIDTFGYPGAAALSWLKSHSNLRWIGFYLKSPSHPDASYMTRRAEIAALGWGMAPIYVGQQVTGPGSHTVTFAQGKIDGEDACAKMREAGFPRDSFVYLDLENGPPLTEAQHLYVGAWIDAVTAYGYGAGVYCSFLMARDVAALRPRAGVRLWVFHVPSTKAHPVDGPNFPTPDPSHSGYAEACIWQRDDEARILVSSDPHVARLGVDLNVAASPDPSAPPEPRPVLQPASPHPAPAPPVAVNQPSKETKPMSTTTETAALAPSAPIIVSTSQTFAPIFATLNSLESSVSAEAVAIYHKVAPWYVQTFVREKVVTDAVHAAFSAVEGAAAGAMQGLPSVEKIMRTAIDYIEAHEPWFLDSFSDNVEDLVIVKLQKLGVLPANFVRELAPKPTPAVAKAA